MSKPPVLDGRVELLGTPEVARLLRVHPKHVYRLLRRGLPAHRLGGEWRYDPREVMAWVQQRPSRSSTVAEPSSVTLASAEAPPLLAANGDLCVELLVRAVSEATGQTLGFVPADRTSGQKLVESGRVAAAGVHGEGAPRVGEGLIRIHVTRRQLGLAFRKRDRLRSIASVSGARLATRAPSSGIRSQFDAALKALGLNPDQLQKRAAVESSHRDVVLSILSGKTDAGIVSLAWAERAGLSCLPFAEEAYDLCLRPAVLVQPTGRALVRALQGRDLRKQLAGIAGYDPRDAGVLWP